MDFKRVMAVGILGIAFLISGCGKKTAFSGSDSGSVLEVPPPPKYASSVNISQAGLQLDYLNENITVSPDGKLGILVASKVPMSNLPKGQQVEYESHLVLVDLFSGDVSSLDQGEFVKPVEWSPAGDKILYRKDDNLYIVEPSSGRSYRIATRAYCGSISPDGTKVAFVQRGKGLFICETDGSNVKKLSGEPGDWYPVWYPDGRYLFYFADRQVELGDGAGRLQGLGRLDVETGAKDVLIPREKGKYTRAEWIVPGKSLLVDKGWDDLFSKIIVNVEAGKVYELGKITGVNMYAAAIDKSRGIVYKAQGSKVTGIDVNGREITSFLPKQPERLKFSQDNGIAVSPDGSLLAYLSPEQSSAEVKAGGRRVWMVNADGSDPVELSGDYSGYYPPVWTPDGKNIVILELSTGADRGFILKNIEVKN